MKSAALKLLAFGGIALAIYPVASRLQPDARVSAKSPDIASGNSASPAARADTASPPQTALALSPAKSEPIASGSSVIIRPDASGHFKARATINGIAIPVLFDTGASIFALSYEDATKLGIRLSANDFHSQIQTANGIAPAAEVMLREVRIDNITIPDVTAMVLPPGKLETSLLGRSFWGRLKTGFSYASGNLILKN